MANNRLTSRQIAICASLAAFSAAVQLIHVGYLSPQWGMWIDVVSVSWIIAYFLFGLRASFLVAVVGAIIITLFAPDTWLGASMKFMATVPIPLSFALYAAMRHKTINWWAKPYSLIIPVVVGIIIRCLIVLPLNYYYALPIWTGMTTQAAMKAIPWYIIAGFNIIQTLVDVCLAWIIVFRFNLKRFRGSETENV